MNDLKRSCKKHAKSNIYNFICGIIKNIKWLDQLERKDIHRKLSKKLSNCGTDFIKL